MIGSLHHQWRFAEALALQAGLRVSGAFWVGEAPLYELREESVKQVFGQLEVAVVGRFE